MKEIRKRFTTYYYCRYCGEYGYYNLEDLLATCETCSSKVFSIKYEKASPEMNVLLTILDYLRRSK